MNSAGSSPSPRSSRGEGLYPRTRSDGHHAPPLTRPISLRFAGRPLPAKGREEVETPALSRCEVTGSKRGVEKRPLPLHVLSFRNLRWPALYRGTGDADLVAIGKTVGRRDDDAVVG
jgi:hypothetical protein